MLYKISLFLISIIFLFSSNLSAQEKNSAQILMERLQPLVEEFQGAADAGDADAQFQLAWLLSTAPFDEQDKAIELMQQSADQGHCEGLVNFAFMKQRGWKSLKKDKEGAFEYFRIGAEAGCIRSQKFLGDAYQDGDGVKRNYEQANLWYEKAANAGEPISAYMLGEVYRKGKKGPKKNLSEALYWYMVSKDGEVEGRSKQRIERMLKITKKKMDEEDIHNVETRFAEKQNADVEKWRNYLAQ